MSALTEVRTEVRPEVTAKILQLTHAFEGGSLVGDFDGALLSYGPLQWNHGSRTLRPLLLDLVKLPEVRAQLGEALVASLASDAAFERFIRSEIHDPTRKHPGAGPMAKQEWINRFNALYRLPGVAGVFVKHAQPYLVKAAKNARALGFHSERGLALMKDITTQNGDIRWDHFKLFRDRLTPYDDTEWERLKVLAHVIADCANPRWHDDVLSRKLTIALGSTRNSGLRVHGRDVDLERDFGISYWSTWYELPEGYASPMR